MTRGKFLVAVGVTAWALGTAPAWAQRERGGGAETTGSASDRSSGGSSTSSGGGGSTTSSGGGSSSSSSSGGGGYSAPSTPSGSSSREYATAPVRPGRDDRETAQGRTPSNGGGGRRPSADGGERPGRLASRSSRLGLERRLERLAHGGCLERRQRLAVAPRGSDLQPAADGRTVTGRAVDRPAGSYPGGGGGNSPSSTIRATVTATATSIPGTASASASTTSAGTTRTTTAAIAATAPTPAMATSVAGTAADTRPAPGVSSYGRGPVGSLRLKIKPRDAQVYVDGYFVGDDRQLRRRLPEARDRRRRPPDRDQGAGSRADLVRRADHAE